MSKNPKIRRRRALTLEQVAEADGRYSVEAYHFLFESLRHTQRRLGRDPAKRKKTECHVTGQEMCEGIREYASKRFGFMARTVFRRWGIRSTRDFGEMVYLLIRHHMMERTKSDSLEDFDHVYDFDEAFEDPFNLDVSRGEGAPGGRAASDG